MMYVRRPKKAGDGSLGKSDEPIYLTEAGLTQLKEKLARLKRALPKLVEETARTAAYGDRSDNAEYKMAKGSLRRTTWQILEIEDQMKWVKVIAEGPNASGKIGIGSTVVLVVDGKEKTYQILGSDETDPAGGRISYKSPLGAALMNHAKGDLVVIKTESGVRTYKILEVR